MAVGGAAAAGSERGRGGQRRSGDSRQRLAFGLAGESRSGDPATRSGRGVGCPRSRRCLNRFGAVANDGAILSRRNPMSNMTYREFEAPPDQLNKQIRELRDRTSASSLGALSDDAFVEEVEYFLYLDRKAKKLFAALDAVPRASNSAS